MVTVCTTRFNIFDGHRGLLSPALKRPGREAHCWPLSSAEVKKDWSYTSTPMYALMAFIETTLLYVFFIFTWFNI
jgi:hypothetical protein